MAPSLAGAPVLATAVVTMETDWAVIASIAGGASGTTILLCPVLTRVMHGVHQSPSLPGDRAFAPESTQQKADY